MNADQKAAALSVLQAELAEAAEERLKERLTNAIEEIERIPVTEE